jgi:hypothetical protein
VGFKLIDTAGTVLKHAIGVLLLVWRRMLQAALIAGAAGFLLAEILAAVLAGQFPPPIPAHVAALAFAAALAYCAAVTVLIVELFEGVFETLRLLEGDATAITRSAAVAAEREVGDLRGMFGLRPPRRAAPPANAAAAATSARAPGETSDETLEEIAATDEFTSTAPRPRVNARPVRADQLPRISWAYEQHPEGTNVTENAPGVTLTELPDVEPLPPLPPLPLKDPAAAPAAEPPVAEPPPMEPPLAPLSGVDASAETSGSEPPAADTPTIEPRTAPTDSQPVAVESRGIWSRISQALVGNTLVEPADWSEPSAAETSADAGGEPSEPR